MSDRRFSSFDPEIEALLDAERAIPPPPPGARERVLSRVAVSVGLAGAGLAAASTAAQAATRPLVPPPPPAAPLAAGAGRLAILKLTAACLFGAAMGGAIYLGLRHHGDAALVTPVATSIAAPAPSTPAPAPEADAPAVAQEQPAPASSAPPLATSRPRRARVADGAVARAVPDDALPTSDLTAERALLEKARAALALDDSAAALGALRKHAARFPRGQLSEERESLRVRVLAAAHRDDEARAVAAEFKGRFPGSVYLPAIDATLQSLR